MIIEVKSLFEISNLIKRRSDTKTVIVSIRCPEDTALDFSECDNILDSITLKFNDIDRDYPGYPAPKKEDFYGLKEFIDKYKDNVDRIIVHCHAGISRSSACASAISRYLNINDNFIWDSGKYCPNKLVFKFSLEELEFNIDEDIMDDLYSRLYKSLEIEDLPIFE